jgi:hypothetical protein
VPPRFDATSDTNGDTDEDAEFFKHVHLEISHSGDSKLYGQVSEIAVEELARNAESEVTNDEHARIRVPYSVSESSFSGPPASVPLSPGSQREAVTPQYINLGSSSEEDFQKQWQRVSSSIDKSHFSMRPFLDISGSLQFTKLEPRAQSPAPNNRRPLPEGFDKVLASYRTRSLYNS